MTPLARLVLAILGLAACDVGPDAERRAAPRVVAVTYDSGTADVAVQDGPVPVWASVDVWFDRFLDPDSVKASAVRLQSNAQIVRAAVQYDPLDRRVRISPSRALDPTLAYRVVVSDSVRSLGGVAAVEHDSELSTGPAADDGPPVRPSIGWGEAETLIETRCESASCHGDDETVATCGQAAPWSVALGLELDQPGAIRSTAIDVRARQWPGFSRIEPGRPDRSYVTYKLADFGEEVVVGNLMPTTSSRGADFEANGDTLAGACCAVESLPRLHPPPWAAPTGRFDPDALRKRSLAWRTPSVWACACADTRGRFDPPAGRCAVAEGDCGDAVDGDGDGKTDCDDSDCDVADECPHAIDDDGDGAIDCDDFDCSFSPSCFEGLERPGVEPVSYCRARSLSDWILDGAVLGPEREGCERLCAARCDAAVTTRECIDRCIGSRFDESAEGCVREALCAGFGGPAPAVDADGRMRLGADGCTATCEGSTVVGCVADGAGESDRCAPTCQASCASIGDLCPTLQACGLGGG